SPDAPHFITSQTGGVLANIKFHINGIAPTGNSTIHIVIPPAMSPDGFTSSANPASGPDAPLGNYTLAAADQVDRVVNVQNFNPAAKLSTHINPRAPAGPNIAVPATITTPAPTGSWARPSADGATVFDRAILRGPATGAVTAGSVVPATGWTVTYGVDNTAG